MFVVSSRVGRHQQFQLVRQDIGASDQVMALFFTKTQVNILNLRKLYKSTSYA